MTTVAFVVNGDPSSPMAYRARSFADRLRGRHEVRILYRSPRKVWSVIRLAADLLRWRPRLCYVLDIAYSGVGGGLLYKCLTGNRLVVDTGDAVTELARSLGRGPVGVALTRGLEALALAAADGIVVRGSYHKEWLAGRGFRAEVIPDGVDCDQVTPLDVADLRRRYGLDGVLTVGLVGSSVWSERLQTCYGWDLVEVIRLLRDQPVKGILIGDGSGLAVLRERCRAYGIEDRVLFLGRLPYEELARHLSLIDVCLSTQTNDLVGQVRTTGKLPLYLATGRYILASRVGEAARVLDDDMLVPYDGQLDPGYPERLALRLRDVLADRSRLGRGAGHVGLAREKFDYAVLARRVEEVIEDVVGERRPARPAVAMVANGEGSRNGVGHAGRTPVRVPRLALLADFPEEGWPSMELAAERLHHAVLAGHAADMRAERVCPSFRRRAGRLPLVGRGRTALNADRLANRHWDYPRHLRRLRNEFDLFHVVDHSYAQLVHGLPADRTGVFCHDVDAFRCLLEPARDPRPAWFRAVARRVLDGFRKAALVFYSTDQVRRQIERHGLADPARLVHAPYGVAPEFTPDAPGPDRLPAPVADLGGAPFLLHVGSCIPRKRVDVLLDVFAAVRRRVPGLRLVKVGADWSADQRRQIDRLGVADRVVPLCGLDRRELAARYRAAAAVLLPSEAEGFGLPVIEALACGGAVVASDLPALREVGGAAAVYCPVGDVSAWAETVGRLLGDPGLAPARPVRLAQAGRFSWAEHARIIVEAYRRLLEPGRPATRPPGGVAVLLPGDGATA
jgi:glycosyltransferase involved in cell wall biosynthesis